MAEEYLIAGIEFGTNFIGGGASKGFIKFRIKNRKGPAIGISIQKIDDKYLKRKGVDAHEVKKETYGKSVEISKYDLYVDKSTGQIYAMRKGGKGEPTPTGYFLK